MSEKTTAPAENIETVEKSAPAVVARNLRIPAALDAAILKHRFRLEHDKAPETFIAALALGEKALAGLTPEDAAAAVAEYVAE